MGAGLVIMEVREEVKIGRCMCSETRAAINEQVTPIVKLQKSKTGVRRNKENV